MFSIFNYSTLKDGKMNKNRQLEVENTIRFFFRSLQNTNTISGLQEQKYLEKEKHLVCQALLKPYIQLFYYYYYYYYYYNY